MVIGRSRINDQQRVQVLSQVHVRARNQVHDLLSAQVLSQVHVRVHVLLLLVISLIAITKIEREERRTITTINKTDRLRQT